MQGRQSARLATCYPGVGSILGTVAREARRTFVSVQRWPFRRHLKRGSFVYIELEEPWFGEHAQK
jgi:hypothetical protein